jgi:hypothetical protein
MAAGDLLIVSFPVTALRTGAAPNGLGAKWHALLFDQLRRIYPAVAGAVHDLDRKPFTISPVLDAPDGEPLTSVEEGQQAWVRLSALDVALPYLMRDPDAPHHWLSDLWLDLIERLPERLSMRTDGPSPWDYVRDRVTPAAVVSRSSFGELADTNGALPWRWQLRFRTPTTFHLSLPKRLRSDAPDLFLPLPDPALVLGGLAVVWRTWAPGHVAAFADAEAVDDLIMRVELPVYRTEGARVTLAPRETRAAFTGEAELRYRAGPRESPAGRDERLRLLAALLGLAPFAGIGVKTARGMGLVSVWPVDGSG